MTIHETTNPREITDTQTAARPATVRLLPGLRPRAEAADQGGDPRTRPLTEPEVAAVVVVGFATGLLGLVGLFNSFTAVAHAAAGSFGSAAWTLPLAIDLGIAVFSALDLLLARLDLRPAWLRLAPWSLIGVTIYLNVSSQQSWFGRIAHAALPALWVVAVEVATHAIRIRAGLGSTQRLDRIRPTRWLLAPAATVLLWRRMVLWETRSYPTALARERDRLLALTALQDRYGRLAWRWKAPRRQRALYRLGQHTPTTPDTDAGPAPDTDAGTAAVDSRSARPTARDRAVRAVGRTPRSGTAAAVVRLRAEYPDMTAAAIADRLGISDRTVRRHLSTTTASSQAS